MTALQTRFFASIRGEEAPADSPDALSLVEATTPDALDRVFRLRYRLYLQEGYISPCPDERFTDRYDPWSVNYTVQLGSRPIGTVRMIWNSPIGFWTEALFNFPRPDLPADQLGEISRLAIDRAYRGDRQIFLTLAKTMFDLSMRRGIRYVFINVPRIFEIYIRRFGVPLVDLPEHEPTAAHLAARRIIAGYFEKARLRPFLIDVTKIDRTLQLDTAPALQAV